MTTSEDSVVESSFDGGGRATLEALAPEGATTFTRLVGIRPVGVHDELLTSPAVVAFAEQFAADVSRIDGTLRHDLTQATGDHLFAVAQMVWIGDAEGRLRSALDAVFGPSVWVDERRTPAADVWAAIEDFMHAVARLDALDATTTELVRLRGARQHECRICSSRRSKAAIDEGADDASFEAVDHYADSDLPAATKAALALTDAIIWTPHAIPADVVDAVRRELTPEQALEVVLDVIRNAANKIAVALGADAPEVTEGVQLFTTDADGTLTTL